MEQFCIACNTTHESPKWYNAKGEQSGLICKKSYLSDYYKRNKQQINDERKERYHSDTEVREKINEKNKQNDKLRRSSGYVRKRKLRTEWTADEKQRAKEAKQRYKENHPDRIIEQNKKFHAKHYKENTESYAKANAKARKTVEYQYSYLKANAERRNCTVELTFDQFKAKRKMPCHYCHRTLEETGTCLDILDPKERIYNELGTVTCCRVCNYLKGSYLTEEDTLFAVLALNSYHCDKVIPDKINFALGSTSSKLSVEDLFVKFNLTCNMRGIETSLTGKNFTALLKQPCFYCGGVNTGLDRLDNKDGYHLYNCVPCCGVCNRIKADIFDYEETLVIVNAVQKLRMNNLKEKGLKKDCVVCGADESPKWIKHPTPTGYLCPDHYKDVFAQANNQCYAQFDTSEVYDRYYGNILNRTKNPRKKSFVARNSEKVYEKYKQIIESRQMELLTTYEDYKCAKEKHKLLTIKCSKGHISQRDCARIKHISTCPDCVGVANKGGAFKEKLATKGWTYVSGEYVNKQSVLTVICEHGYTTTQSYAQLRDKTCPCSEH